MKIGKKIGYIVIGYFAIGVLITLTQLGLSKLFEPPCKGVALYTLRADFPKQVDDSDALQGKPDQSLIFGLARGVVRWLPDLYAEVVAGDMTVQNYLLGGFHCYSGFPLPYGLGSETTPESRNKPEDSHIEDHDVWAPKDARKP